MQHVLFPFIRVHSSYWSDSVNPDSYDRYRLLFIWYSGSFVRVAPGLQIRRFVRGATAFAKIKDMCSLTSFYCDITIAQLFDWPFDCDVLINKSANRCNVEPFTIRKFWPEPFLRMGLNSNLQMAYTNLKWSTLIWHTDTTKIYQFHEVLLQLQI